MCFGGASDSMKALSKDSNQFYQTLQDNYAQQFKGQGAILDSLKSSFLPVLQAGINQFGYSKPEETALRTQSTEGTAAAARMVKQATGENLAAVGGGNEFLPSSTKTGILSDVDTKAALADASNQLGITTSGYALGRQNYLTAASGLSGVASMENPTAYAGSALGAGQQAFGDAQAVDAANQRGWQAITGLVGGAADSFLSGFGSGLGKGKGSTN